MNSGLRGGAGRRFCLPTVVLLLSGVVCASSFANDQGNPQKPRETIRVSVDRVDVGVIVTDAQGRFVNGLRREDFRVFDNGAEQPVMGFAAIEEPAQVLLLIEAGPAVYFLESGHVWAANSLLGGLSADDHVAVVKYAEAPTALLDFTADKQAAVGAFGQLRFNLGFASLNLSSSVSKVLEWLESVEGKKTIVLLSTGVDTSRQDEAALAMEQLKVHDVRLFAISLTGGLQSPQTAGKKKAPARKTGEISERFEEAGKLLKQMAEATGGRAYFPESAAEFNSAYAEVAQLVRHEYSVAFAPPVRDGMVHSVEVRVNATQTARTQAAGHRVDHRRAYLAPAASK